MWVIFGTILMSTLIFQNVSTEIDTEKNQPQYRSSRFSVGFHILLPVAGLILVVLGRKQIFEKILLQLDKRYLTVICPRFIKKEALLKWASGRLPPTWSSYSTKTLSEGIKDLWTDGSLLCTLINTGVPGACPNPHRHWKQPPVHAQALAYKYFGVAPIFTNEELKMKLSSTLDRRFLRYLSDIQLSINRASDNDNKHSKISDRYIVRGMGLFSGEQYKTAVFYIYLDENFDDDNESNIIIQIKGPFGTFGEAIAPRLINKKRKRRPIKIERRQSIKLIENLQSLQSNIINFTRSQKKYCGEEIDVEGILENERIKVTYYPKYHGMYEINMVGGGEVLKCCPFNVHIFANENTKDQMKTKHIETTRKIKGEIKENNSLRKDIIYEEKFTSTKSTFNFKRIVIHTTNNGEANANEITEKIKLSPTSLKSGKYYLKENSPEIPNNNDTFDEENDKKIINTDKCRSSSSSEDVQLKDLIDKENVSNKKIIFENISNEITANKNQLYDQKFKNSEEINDKVEKIDKIRKVQELGNKTENEALTLSVSNDPISTNNGILNKQISNGNNLKSNNFTSQQINDSKHLINDCKQVDHKVTRYIFEPKYLENVNINKIKIPERFVDAPMKNYPNNLDDKYFKNIVNESNKVTRKINDFETNKETEKRNNGNRNLKKNYDADKDEMNNNSIKNRVQRYLDKLENHSRIIGNQSKRDTSPICTEHIALEVDFMKKNVAERREIFAQSSVESEPNSINSSFSENESSLGSSIKKHHHIVYNILNDSKEPINSTKDSWSLCSTISLPNLSLESEWSSVNSVKDKKFFWENISSRSSISVSTKSLSPRKSKRTLSELERSKLIWKKPNETVEVKDQNIFKSADDILSATESLVRTNSKKYQSVDESLDKCTVLSIEERKKLLLRQVYETEKPKVKNKIIHKIEEVKDISVVKMDELDVKFNPVWNRINRYNSALQLSTKGTVKEELKDIRKIKSFHTSPSLSKKDDIETLNNSVYQFNTAIKYFKNLESQSQHINNTKSEKSNNGIIQKQSIRYRTGSLNLPNITDKYSIKNLYEDIFGNKRGFKGTPNKSAVVEALATFSRTSNLGNNADENEDNIKYDIFKRVKKRKRKSLNSIFDVYY